MNKGDVKDKEDIEKYYSTSRKIRFNKQIEPSDIQEIFTLIRSSYNSEATYYINGSEHCDSDRIRSIDDYIKLCKFYFPEITVEQVIKSLSKQIIMPTDRGYRTTLDYCGNIRKENFRDEYYRGNTQIVDSFANKEFSQQGFKECTIKYKDFL